MTAELNIPKFEEFIAQYPVFEYRILDSSDISVEDRVRIVCQQECERYNTTWACPPAVGTLDECARRIHAYDKAVFFSQCGRSIRHHEYGRNAFHQKSP